MLCLYFCWVYLQFTTKINFLSNTFGGNCKTSSFLLHSDWFLYSLQYYLDFPYYQPKHSMFQTRQRLKKIKYHLAMALSACPLHCLANTLPLQKYLDDHSVQQSSISESLTLVCSLGHLGHHYFLNNFQLWFNSNLVLD